MELIPLLCRWIRIVCYRLLQILAAIVKLPMGYRMPEYRRGPGRARQLGVLLRDKQLDHVLVITGTTIQEQGVVEPVLESLRQEGIDFRVEAFRGSAPTEEDVQVCYEAFVDRGRQAIVAIGGASRIDCAKAVAARLAQPRKSTSQLVGSFRVHRETPVVVAIPTNVGSGAEASMEAVLTDPETRRKRVIRDPAIMPRYVVLDPELMGKAPPKTIALGGLLALSRAVEGYLNLFYSTPWERRRAVRVVQLVRDNLYEAWRNPSNVQAIENLQEAGLLAARINNRCRGGYVQGLSYAIDAKYRIPSVEASAVLLPHVLDNYHGFGRRRLGRLALRCGFSNIRPEARSFRQVDNQARREDAHYHFIHWITDIKWMTQTLWKFEELREPDFNELLTITRQVCCPWFSVPEYWNRANLENLLKRVRQ